MPRVCADTCAIVHAAKASATEKILALEDIVQYLLTIQVNTSNLSGGERLARLLGLLRAIQIARGHHPWLPLKLTMAQLKAVMLLVQSGRMRSRELADGLRIAPPAATPLIDRLVAQKLAARQGDDNDRRIIWIRPTAKAVALHDTLMQANRTVLAEVLAAVPVHERKKIQESILILLDCAERVLKGGGKAEGSRLRAEG
jgi:DNA-binding MarR family transcriptional regulator